MTGPAGHVHEDLLPQVPCQSRGQSTPTRRLVCRVHRDGSSGEFVSMTGTAISVTRAHFPQEDREARPGGEGRTHGSAAALICREQTSPQDKGTCRIAPVLGAERGPGPGGDLASSVLSVGTVA